MVKRVKKIIYGIPVLLLLASLSACSAEELLHEVPQTAKLEYEWRDIQEKQDLAQDDEKTEQATALQSDGNKTTNSFLSETAYLYAYNCLTEPAQLWYNDMAVALGKMQETVRLSDAGLEAGLDETCIDRIFQCVLNDHPELFYVSGYTYTKYYRGETVVAIEFSGTYELNLDDALVRKQEIEQAAQLILDGIDEAATEYDKVKYVYDTIVRSTDYDLQAPDNQNIYSVFVGHSSVCQGYAKAAQYLLNRLGVACTLVQGSVEEGQGHAWNLVKVDGSFYYMDVTWGDASYQAQDGTAIMEAQLPEINYDYLCITTNQLLYTHSTDNCVPLPECLDMAANYYVRQGAYFEGYDREQLQQLFQGTLGSGRTDVTVKCADADCFAEIQTALVDNQEIFDYLVNGKDTIAYASNDKQLSLTFWVTNQ